MLVPAVFVLQQTWMVWPQGWMYTVRWGLVAALLLLSVGTYRRARRMEEDGSFSPAWRRRIRLLRPLSLLPLGAVISLLADLLPLGLVSNGLFFLPVLVLTAVVNRLMDDGPAQPPDGATTRRWAWWLLGGTTLFFLGVGLYVSATTGEHVGDEGHYIIQAQSLFLDRDLDIKNNFAPDGTDLSAVDPTSIHIAPTALAGHWYSWHPYGLSLLLAPFWPGGMPLRQLLLGLISGAGCVGLWLICRRVGASLRSSLAAILLLAGSVYWTIYSVRSLPEVLGASLIIWVFWAIAAQRDKPWLSLWVAAACCVYLPFAHMRFLPVGLMGFGLYGLAGLCGRESWGRKIVRLSVFTLLCLAGAAVYGGMQRHLFAGGDSYSVGQVFFTYPLGAWAVLADGRGVTAVFPLFMWLAAAWVAWVACDRDNRWFALGIGATFLTCLLTSATNTYYIGGSCVPGRFALVVVPLLIPAAARMLDRAPRLARGWFVFLGLMSFAVLIVMLVRLPLIGRDFVLPGPAISGHPLLQALFAPHSTFIYEAPWANWVTSLYVASGIALTLVMLLAPAGRKVLPWLALAAMGAVGIAAHTALANRQAKPYDAGFVAAEWLKLDLDRASITRKGAARTAALFEVSRYVFRDVRNPQRRPIVTTRDLGERRTGQTVSQPRLEKNDWAGRDFRWTTLTAPIDPPRGRKLIHVGGRLEGTATVVFVVREGSHTLFEGPLPSDHGVIASDIDVLCRSRSGHLYLLLRLENGEGVFSLDDLYWSPYSDRLLQAAQVQLPAGRLQGQKIESGL
jgi:hypothetical protein